MSKVFTDEQIQEYKNRIDVLTQLECCRLWRFSPSGHPYFRADVQELFNYFKKRMAQVGGMTPAISKRIGWEE